MIHKFSLGDLTYRRRAMKMPTSTASTSMVGSLSNKVAVTIEAFFSSRCNLPHTCSSSTLAGRWYSNFGNHQLWRHLARVPQRRIAIYWRSYCAKNLWRFFGMKKLWLASPLLLASLCLAAQTGNGSSSSSNSANQPSATQSSSQNSNSSATTPSTSDQATTPSTSDQTGTAATDQNNAATTNQTGRKAGKKLPQTASPLPLLGLLGLGSLGTGLFRFRKR